MTQREKPEPSKSSGPIKFENVLKAELRQTRGVASSSKTLTEVFDELYDQNLVALCFSGGGIRSATFGLGIVQALAKHGLLTKFDYLSTVSGGGYLGSWLSAWVHRELKKAPKDEKTGRPDPGAGIENVQSRINCQPLDGDSANPEPAELRHLREYSNYMSPRKGLLSADTWTLVAIYLRNLFLNLTIFIPLLAAVLFLPRFLFQLIIPPDGVDTDRTIAFILLGVAMVTGAVAIGFVVSRLPSRRAKRASTPENADLLPEKPFLNTDGGVLLVGVLPLIASAFISAMLWAWNHRVNNDISKLIDPQGGLSVWFFVIAAAGAWLFGLLVYAVLNRSDGKDKWTSIVWGFVASLLAAILGAVLLWLVSQHIFGRKVMESLGEWLPGFEWQVYVALSVPLFLALVLLSATVFIGLSSRIMTDEDREWLARYGGWVMIAGGVWILLNALVLIAPSLISIVFRGAANWRDDWTQAVIPTIVSITGAVSGVVSLLGGFSSKSEVRPEGKKTWRSTIIALAPRVAAVIFLGFILTGLAAFGTFLARALGLVSSWSHIQSLKDLDIVWLLILFVGLAAVGVAMACFVNVNKFSLHSAYRDRLVRAYLGASNTSRDQTTFTGFDDADNLQLRELAGQRPLHIINATVNLIGGDNLAWQNRKAASFTMSPLHCGSTAVGGYRSSEDYCISKSSDKALRLGTAMAISGAAANPNMGYFSSPVVTFLMSLFNIRLGWWLGNTGKRGSDEDWFGLGKQKFYQKVSPSIAVLPLINETFGQTNENKRFLMVTDGGHFENLALYEMVLRRCRLIVLSDGAADADFKFGEIANAIQKCKVDLGVDIKFVGAMNIVKRGTKEEGEVKHSRFAVAKITYPESGEKGQNVGWLLYLRPTYYGTEPRDIRYYAEANEQFPHQSTGDQMYDEQQFEAYRGLGFMTMDEIINGAQVTDLAKWLETLKTEGN